MTSEERENLTQDELNALLSKWQTVLGLSHYQISIRYMRKRELENEGALAEVWHGPEHYYAKISMLDRQDYPSDDSLHPYDEERAIIHELLHLVFWHIDTDSGIPWNLFERSLEQTAQALFNLSRANT